MRDFTGDNHGDGSRGPSRRRRLLLYRLFFRTLTATFFLAGALVLLTQYRQAAGWPVVPARVDVATVVPSGDPDDSRVPGERWEPVVRYRYTAGGKEHTSERLTVHRWIYRRRDRAEAVLLAGGVVRGATIQVHVNPADPREAVIVTDIPWRRGEVVLAVLFLVVLPVVVVGWSIRELFHQG